MALKGILLAKGHISSAKGNPPSSLLKDDVSAVFVDDVNIVIYLWRGSSTRPIDKFKAARLAHMLNWKLFGGAGRIIQDENKVKAELQKYPTVDDDIPRTEIVSILG